MVHCKNFIERIFLFRSKGERDKSEFLHFHLLSLPKKNPPKKKKGGKKEKEEKVFDSLNCVS